MDIELEFRGETKTLTDHLTAEWLAAHARGDKDMFNLFNAALATIRFQTAEIHRLDSKIAALESSLDLATGKM